LFPLVHHHYDTQCARLRKWKFRWALIEPMKLSAFIDKDWREKQGRPYFTWQRSCGVAIERHFKAFYWDLSMSSTVLTVL
jgi:hypothetical protein